MTSRHRDALLNLIGFTLTGLQVVGLALLIAAVVSGRPAQDAPPRTAQAE